MSDERDKIEENIGRLAAARYANTLGLRKSVLGRLNISHGEG